MSEKNPSILLKLLAIVLAVALGGTYVGWRQYKANQAAEHTAKTGMEPEDMTLMISSKNPGRDVFTIDLDSENPPDGEGTKIERALMSSSKSMIMTDFVEIDESTSDELGFDWILEPSLPEDPKEEEEP